MSIKSLFFKISRIQKTWVHLKIDCFWPTVCPKLQPSTEKKSKILKAYASLLGHPPPVMLTQNHFAPAIQTIHLSRIDPGPKDAIHSMLCIHLA